MFKINVLNLKEGEHKSEYTVKPSELELDEKIFVNDINIDVIMHKSSYQLEIEVIFKSKVLLNCDRCLEDYSFNAAGKFNLYFKPLLMKSQDIVNSNDEESFRFYSTDSKYIDLTIDIRDFIILSIPMRKVPDELNGICTECNRKIDELLNRNEDSAEINPVWNKLLKKKNK